MHILTPQEISLEHHLESGYSFAIEIIAFRFPRITRRQGEGDEAYFTYVEKADDVANKVS
jgi:hypothetical protein